jgi:type VI secretion system secreted protein VgrG
MLIQANASTVDALDNWRSADATAIGKVTLNDYDPLKPSTPVTANTSTIAKAAGASQRAVVAWPALTDKASVAAARVKLRQEAAEAWSHVSQASGFNQHFGAGGKFTLNESDWTHVPTGEYIIHSVSHSAHDEAQATGGGGVSYQNSFTAFPAQTKWRQPLATPRPQMGGIWTAIVLGPDGEEIHTDQYGRIKVGFFWDYTPDAAAGNTIWVRVMQPWSGNKWGWQHIPRVGSEVAVAFVDGDPDHPIVVGSLYNAQQMHPFPLPDMKTKSGIKTRSSKQGGTADYNEFSFDDKKGEEMVLLHAQKDHSVTVENDETVLIMHDQKITVDHDRTRMVKHDETITIKNNQTITVVNDRTAEISTGNETLTVKTGDMSTKVSKGNHAVEVAMGNMATKVSMGNVDLKVAMGNVSTAIDMGNWATKLGMGNVTVKTGLGAISMEAMQSIELKVGPSSIKIDPMGVTISGMMLKFDGTLMTDISGLMTTIKGTAMLQEKGAIVMIGP